MSTVQGIHGYGVSSARPAANSVVKGSQYWDTDSSVLSQSDGSSWAILFTSPSGGAGGAANNVNGYRLTLASGYPVFSPTPATPSGTDTGTEVVTFASDPGFVTGMVCTPASTVGGLTLLTRYFYGRLSGTTGAFYTTLANALADSSRVDLTASITASIIPAGLEGKTLYLTPYNGNQIGLYTGAAWSIETPGELSLALSGLTANKPYDVFVDYNGGTPQLVLQVWTDATTRATALALQDGILVDSVNADWRYVGTIYTTDTDTTADTAGGIAAYVGGQRFVWNACNRIEAPVHCIPQASNWTYNSATIRQSNATAGARIQYVDGLAYDAVSLHLTAEVSPSSSGNGGVLGFGTDSTTVFDVRNSDVASIEGTGSGDVNFGQANYYGRNKPGYHAVNWLEASTAAITTTWRGNTAFFTTTAPGFGKRPGIIGAIRC